MCSNSVTTDTSSLSWTVGGVAPASATVGDTVTLSDQTWSVTVPGSVFDAGVNLDLLVNGQVVTADVTATVLASNTAEASAEQSGIPISLTVVLDSTGAAEDAVATFAVADMSFAATGGDIDFSMGDVVMAVDIGLPISISFSCSPEAGQAAFHTVAVSGAPVSTTTAAPTTTTVATQVAGAQELAFTGPGETLLIGIIGFILLDFGYMAFTAARPRRRDQSA